MRILLVDDDESVAKALKKALTDEHYAVDVANDGHIGWQLANAFDYDLIVLDVVLPKLDGLQFCQRLRQQSYNMPVLLVTALDSSTKKIAGLDAGADDYITKPFEIDEFLARVRVLLRRGQAPLISTLVCGELRLDPTSRDVHYGQTCLSLTPKEYSLLELLLRNPSQVFSRGAILDNLWNCEEAPGEDTVTAHMKGLRRKLTQAGAPSDLIKTVYGVGYRLNPSELPEPRRKDVSSHQAKISSPALDPALSGPGSLSKDGDRPSHDRTKQDRISQDRVLNRGVNSPASCQQKTRTALAALWRSVKPQHLERLNHLKLVAQALHDQQLTPHLRRSAFRAAHSLAGALGIFGLMSGSDLAREIEHLLQGNRDLLADDQARLCGLIDQLEEALNQGIRQAELSPSKRVAPILVLIDNNVALLQQLADAITREGLAVRTILSEVSLYRLFPLLNKRRALSPPPDYSTPQTMPVPLPDVVLFNYSLADSDDADLSQLSQSIRRSRSPVLVSSGSGSLTSRIKATHLGSDFFFHDPSISTMLRGVLEVRSRLHTPAHKILAVDDDPHLLEGLRTLLEPQGLQLVTLHQPTDFWMTLQASSPDLLLLDIEMPELSGIELCRVVRQSPDWNQLPIVFLTAYGDANTQLTALKAGANDLVEKSLANSDLLTCLYTQIRRSHVQQAMATTHHEANALKYV